MDSGREGRSPLVQAAAPQHNPMRNLYKMGAGDSMPVIGDEPVATTVTNMLSPIIHLYRQNIDVMLQPFGVSAGQSPLLSLLLKKDGQFQKDLAQQLGVKPSSLTTMLNRMERSGLLRREKSDTDQRACRVYLTKKGRHISKKMQAVIRFINERNLAGFRGEEKLLLLRLLEQMDANMKKQHAELMSIKDEEQRIKGK